MVGFELDLDSPVLSWQAKVARLLAERVESLVLVADRAGRHDLPANAVVHILPRRPFGVPRRLGGAWLMLPAIHRLLRRHPVDVCFVHMAAEWGYRLAPVLRPRRVPVLMWYAHGSVTWRLKLAHQLVSAVVTSSAEGFRLPSDKLRVIGQGIDSALFRPPARVVAEEVLYVGRISRRKRIDLLVRMMAHVVQQRPLLVLRLVGPLLTQDDEVYAQEIRGLVARLELEQHVLLCPPVTQEESAALYQRAAVHVNVSQTGSMDKTVLESLSAGCPVVTTNDAFRSLLEPFPGLWTADDDAAALAGRVCSVLDGRDRYRAEDLRALVENRHDLPAYVEKVHGVLEQLAAGVVR